MLAAILMNLGMLGHRASNWQSAREDAAGKRFSRDELDEAITRQRIALGILTMPGQAVDAPEDIAVAVADAVHNETVMAGPPIDYETIYRAAFMEAERAIAEYLIDRRKRRNKRTAALLLTN